MRPVMIALLLISTTINAAEIRLSILPYSDDKMPRHAYTRQESPTIRIRLDNPTAKEVKGTGELCLTLAGNVEIKREYSIKAPAKGSAETKIELPLKDLRMAKYQLQTTCVTAGATYMAQAPLWVCADPDNQGLTMGIWWENAYKQKESDEILTRLAEMGMTSIQVMHVYPQLLDDCLWHRISCISISQGNAEAEGFKPGPGEMWRFNATNGVIIKQSIASLDWQKATADNLYKQISWMIQHPAYYPRICTSDDYFQRTGLDYNPWNVRRFKDACGIDPPRPPEALVTDFPMNVNRPKGVIPDNDPWVLWLRFNSLDVLGHYNKLLTETVARATGGRGKIGPVSGGGEGACGFVPYVDMPSGQWPVYNYGENGFNLLCCYNYNYYRSPALAQVWWCELGRMGNRDLEQWLMPESMDNRITSHLQNWYLYMAAGQNGLVYFIYEKTSPAGFEAFGRIKPIAGRYGKLLNALRPVPRTVGLLAPFATSCFHTQHLVESAYAFCNLVMAHVEVEPVLPEELPKTGNTYKVLVLHNIDWITENDRHYLEQYVKKGGILLTDALTEVDMPKAVRLDFPIADGNRETAYGNLEQINRVRQAIGQHVDTWATSDDPHIMIRRFRCDGIDYLWVINLMTHKEDLDHIAPKGKEMNTQEIPAYVGYDKRKYAATINIPADNCYVYDVFDSRELSCSQKDGRLVIPVTMNTWQGVLLALYPAKPSEIMVKTGPETGRAHPHTLQITVMAGKSHLKGSFPMEIDVLQPDGKLNKEYTRKVLARNGQYCYSLPFARNDMTGEWKIVARELSTGLERTGHINLR